MIDKIIEIKGVGRFKDYQASGNVQFKKSTIIYGENGHGKTTLSNILKSLGCKNYNLITNRKTIGLEDQKITINVGGKIQTFKNGKWEGKGVDNRIEVFDAFFINENVYSGFDFSFEHSKNLHKFVLGEEGVKLAADIQKIKNEVDLQNKDLKTQEKSITAQIGTLPFKTFLKLKAETDIDSQIESAMQALSIAKQAKEIAGKPYLFHLSPIDLSEVLPAIKETLVSSLEAIAEQYIVEFEKHKQCIEDKGVSNAVDWLYEGFKAIDRGEEEKCFFCNQTINSNFEIIKAYTQYFNGEYTSLQSTTLAHAQHLELLNYEVLTKTDELRYTENTGLCDYWLRHCSITPPFTKVYFQIEAVQVLLKAIKGSIDLKLSNLFATQDSSCVGELEKLLKNINQKIDLYNKEVDVINVSIRKVKSSDVSVAAALETLNSKNIVKIRFTILKDACDDYKALFIAIKENNERKDALQKELKDYAIDFFEKYGKRINHYLSLFFPGSYYKLENIGSTYSGSSKDPSAPYTLTLNGHPINMTTSEGLQGKFTLSEGDKSSIAFAFFLAKLDLEDISDKIIVFDDPITSLDKNRRRRTIDEIVLVLARAKQVIVLSHSSTFVYDVYEKCSESKALKISYGGLLQDYTSIVDDMQSEYVKKLRVLEAFLANPTEQKIPEARGAIRIVLEDNLKFRFQNFLYKPHVLASTGVTVGPFTNKAGLGTMVDILEASPCLFRKDKPEVLSELRTLNELSNVDHHGGQDKAHRIEQISVGELVGYVQDTIKMIEEKL